MYIQCGARKVLSLTKNYDVWLHGQILRSVSSQEFFSTLYVHAHKLVNISIKNTFCQYVFRQQGSFGKFSKHSSIDNSAKKMENRKENRKIQNKTII